MVYIKSFIWTRKVEIDKIKRVKQLLIEKNINNNYQCLKPCQYNFNHNVKLINKNNCGIICIYIIFHMKIIYNSKVWQCRIYNIKKNIQNKL